MITESIPTKVVGVNAAFGPSHEVLSKSFKLTVPEMVQF
jgi:hypothetical protein